MEHNKTSVGNGPPNTPISKGSTLDSPMTHSIAKSPFKGHKGGKGSGKQQK